MVIPYLTKLRNCAFFKIFQTQIMHSDLDTAQPIQSNISVVVRIRDLLPRESEACDDFTISRTDSSTAVIRDIINTEEMLIDDRRSNRRSHDTDKIFTFDHVFDLSATQDDVFGVVGVPIVDHVIEGINATIFAYGATSAGKTFTMLGTECEPGLMMLTIDALFHRLPPDGEIQVRCSFVEIYNEVVRDLLSVSDFTDSGLEIRDDPMTGQTFVNGACEVCGIKNVDDMMDLLHLGNLRRTTEPTSANETSSRSHAILQIFLERPNPITGEIIQSKLSLIDLAGSERARNTQNRGLRMTEGGSINKSLLALGNCIKALTSDNPSGFVPYRDSKLTRLLRDSLGGNCRTAMIANVSPYAGHYTDSLNTLKFAIGAKNVRMKLRRNSIFRNPQDEIRNYKRMISDLQSTVEVLQDQLRTSSSPLPTPTTTNSSSATEEFCVFTDDEDSDPKSSRLLDECLSIAKKILRESLSVPEIQLGSMSRQPSLIRSKSLLSLRHSGNSRQDSLTSLETLRHHLLLISRSIPTPKTVYPVVASATITSGDWQPKSFSIRQPLRVSLLPNTAHHRELGPTSSQKRSNSSSRSSSGISFN